mmetsp:Transcript_45817/g.55606  ORF Transcript_45817/g.55606 Transcript_45817/m.55606 type:complete len:98 (-) Transcript_45817:33-326(-)
MEFKSKHVVFGSARYGCPKIDCNPSRICIPGTERDRKEEEVPARISDKQRKLLEELNWSLCSDDENSGGDDAEDSHAVTIDLLIILCRDGGHSACKR